jgi:hypothetical protein
MLDPTLCDISLAAETEVLTRMLIHPSLRRR